MKYNFEMSVSPTVLKNDVDSELDWISLRQQLDTERDSEAIIPPYKKSVLLKLGKLPVSLIINSNAYASASHHLSCTYLERPCFRTTCDHSLIWLYFTQHEQYKQNVQGSKFPYNFSIFNYYGVRRWLLRLYEIAGVYQ